MKKEYYSDRLHVITLYTPMAYDGFLNWREIAFPNEFGKWLRLVNQKAHDDMSPRSFYKVGV